MPDVAAQPYVYTFALATTALLVIDMQRDFIEPGGFRPRIPQSSRL
jgi:nicotinamidase-related amidase